jgi:hypothetical protein
MGIFYKNIYKVYNLSANDIIISRDKYLIDTTHSKMASKMKVIFELNTNQGSKIKQVSMHPVKKWVGIINENNTFSLWNYEEKILIKSFSCNTLTDSKAMEIK